MSAKANREYKDSVFTSLFGEKDKLLELYNAIQNTNYGEETDIQITTLENVLYMEQMNDISFVIDNKFVVLIEHQSTINPNMPLRMLLYMGRVYEKIIEAETLYKQNRITIPRPEFIVLYNGKTDYPDEETLKLSDMFEQKEGALPELELIVKVYNINEGKNPQFAERSETLKGYEMFIAMARNYEKNMSRDEAIKKAILDCLEKNVLSTYFNDKGSEVINMLLTEWKTEDALRVRGDEERARGMQLGITQGMRQVAVNMLNDGVDANTVARYTGLFIDDVLRLQY
ncbi:MAG: Rpn family recombination-promoting nuclease/putative transposase [Chitinivibrionia bacterium]|nr:Rpn family recombination-promoting nuclease/putative transposase [Chitinivibrionia bacterium]